MRRFSSDMFFTFPGDASKSSISGRRLPASLAATCTTSHHLAVGNVRLLATNAEHGRVRIRDPLRAIELRT